jgi:hypothetical protein
MKGWQHTSAFVIQFLPEAEVEAGWFEGRVEHIASSMTTHFHSLEEFLAFVSGVLKEVRSSQ